LFWFFVALRSACVRASEHDVCLRPWFFDVLLLLCFFGCGGGGATAAAFLCLVSYVSGSSIWCAFLDFYASAILTGCCSCGVFVD
jgi:hypothetical protein